MNESAIAAVLGSPRGNDLRSLSDSPKRSESGSAISERSIRGGNLRKEGEGQPLTYDLAWLRRRVSRPPRSELAGRVRGWF